MRRLACIFDIAALPFRPAWALRRFNDASRRTRQARQSRRPSRDGPGLGRKRPKGRGYAKYPAIGIDQAGVVRGAPPAFFVATRPAAPASTLPGIRRRGSHREAGTASLGPPRGSRAGPRRPAAARDGPDDASRAVAAQTGSAMTTTDLAKRVYDHTWKLDPIVRSLLDTDFYKLLMLQMIWGLYRDQQVTFSLVNRTTKVRVADEIDVAELRDQLDHARSLRLSKKEMIWLAGNSFYGRAHIFEPSFLAWLADYRLPDYDLAVRDGQFELSFSGCLGRRHAVGDPGPRHHQRVALARRAEGARPVPARCRLRPRQGQAVEQGRAPARPARPAHLGLRHAPPSQLPVAALVRRGSEGGPGRRLHGHQQRLARHGQRPRGARHQRPRAADGAGRAGEGRRSPAPRALPGAGRLAEILWRQPAHRAAGHVRHGAVPARRARLGGGLDRLPPRLGAADRRRRGRHRRGGGLAAAIRATSCWSSRTRSTSTRSRRPTAISTGGCG